MKMKNQRKRQAHRRAKMVDRKRTRKNINAWNQDLPKHARIFLLSRARFSAVETWLNPKKLYFRIKMAIFRPLANRALAEAYKDPKIFKRLTGRKFAQKFK